MPRNTESFTKKALKSPDLVENMFDAVADKYDLANRLLSLGRDQRWRNTAAKLTRATKDSLVLDACTGTADLAIAVHKVTGSKVVGVDFSKDMLRIGTEKVEKSGLSDKITSKHASVMQLPYDDGTFDAVTVGFGLRNTPDYQAAIKEFYRVVRPGGYFVCLESSQPESGDYKAYKYLSDSTQVFPPKKELAGMMRESGWKNVSIKSLLFGGIAIHSAQK
jgi:demethylmenaquinone methyltransferase/2-methoxy-6-polyprenyl-1,4-benzoquinol methylase